MLYRVDFCVNGVKFNSINSGIQDLLSCPRPPRHLALDNTQNLDRYHHYWHHQHYHQGHLKPLILDPLELELLLLAELDGRVGLLT